MSKLYVVEIFSQQKKGCSWDFTIFIIEYLKCVGVTSAQSVHSKDKNTTNWISFFGALAELISLLS